MPWFPMRRGPPPGVRVPPGAAAPAGARLAVAAALAAAAMLALQAPAAATRLPAEVLAALEKAGAPASALALHAVPMGHSSPRLDWQGGRPMQPGSTMKVVTGIVALDRIGIAQTARTRFVTAAPLEAGVLKGDLVLHGGGHPGFGLGQMWQLMLELRDRGIRRIEGDLVLDRTRYRPARLDRETPPFDERPEGWWNVVPDALLLEGGLQAVEFRATQDSVSVRLQPAVAGVSIDTRALALNTLPCNRWSDELDAARLRDLPPAAGTAARGAAEVAFSGAFPRGCTRNDEMQLVDRSRWIELVFAQVWRELGGEWAGRMREGVAPAEARLLAEHRSAPWGEVLRPVMKTSDNTLTRLLFLELGVPGMAAEPAKSTLEIAREVVTRWFADKGIAAPGFVADNGSGLSRSERITPRTLAEMIGWAWQSRHGADLLATLPVVGVDGTMRNRIRSGPASGLARLKTGTLRNVAALAGVAYDAEGRPWAVALMFNHEPGAAGRPVIDAWVDWFAREGPALAPRGLVTGPQGEWMP